jgi:hypothetical protein
MIVSLLAYRTKTTKLGILTGKALILFLQEPVVLFPLSDNRHCAVEGFSQLLIGKSKGFVPDLLARTHDFSF